MCLKCQILYILAEHFYLKDLTYSDGKNIVSDIFLLPLLMTACIFENLHFYLGLWLLRYEKQFLLRFETVLMSFFITG